jgi:hypothetical protein
LTAPLQSIRTNQVSLLLSSPLVLLLLLRFAADVSTLLKSFKQ